MTNAINNDKPLLNMSEETRCGYTVTAETKQLWAVLLRLTCKVLDVCRRNGLPIWADGGTLLGAVRHRGFIPWDDDIDLCMLRADYDRLVAIAPREFSAPYHFQTSYTEPGYARGHAQLRMDGTTAARSIDIDMPFHHGIFIDIFVHDGIPDDSTRCKQLEHDTRQLMSQLELCCRPPRVWWFFSHPFRYMQVQRQCRDIRREGFAHAFGRLEDMFRACPVGSSAHSGAIAFRFGAYVGFGLRPEYYARTIYMPFEGIELPVPAGYGDILRSQYGPDYMQPRQDPTLHGEFMLVDTSRDYRDLLDGLRRQNARDKRRKRWRHILDKIMNSFSH